MAKESIYNLPNALSLIRIFSIPLLIVVCYWSWPGAGTLAAIIFALASATDILDGYLARKLGRVTNLGRFLDPVADKLLVSATLIMLVYMDRAPAWVAFVIIGREIAVTGLRAAAVANQAGLVIDASWWGKFKTLFQMVAIIGLLVHEPHLGFDFGRVGGLALWAATGLTIISGWLYFKDYWAVISRAD